jgi:amidase
VPFTIKENIDVAGQATPNGLPVLADLIAPEDSPVVGHLRRAGGILVGRTNTPEVSMRATTWNPLRGRTWNPWHPDASAGGSSGGAGSAAAAGMGPLHHGNDIGGSLRFPSFCNGVTSIKPTQGRVPAFNPSATAERPLLSSLMSSQGVIARSVADVRLGTEVMAQGDPRDPWWVPAPFTGAPLDGPIRVAVARETHGYPVHPGIAALVDRAAGLLADAGYEVIDEPPPPIVDAARLWFTAGATEMRLSLDPIVRAYGSEELQGVFDTYFAMGEVLDLPGYAMALATRTGLLRRWTTFLDRVPLVLTPFCLRPTYPHDVDTTPHGGRDLLEAAIYSYGFNVLGLPAGVVPVDLVDGLPAGVQLVGRRYREDTVLDAMEAIEVRAGRLVERLWAREA